MWKKKDWQRLMKKAKRHSAFIIPCFLFVLIAIAFGLSQGRVDGDAVKQRLEVDRKISQLGSHSHSDSLESTKRFAEMGAASAQLKLGRMYFEGAGVAKDDALSTSWFEKAAEQGLADAQFDLSIAYANGYGVPKDYQAAAKWCRMAAEQGLAAAEFALGNVYYGGYGLPKDLRKATEWWQKAAEQNFAEAQYSLGRAYLTGEGVTKDKISAYKWINLAAGQGDQLAINALGDMEKSMSVAQLKAGKKLVQTPEAKTVE